MSDIMTQTYDKYIKQTSNALKINNQKTSKMLNGVSNTARLNKTLNNIMDEINFRMNRTTDDVRDEEDRINRLNMQMYHMTNDFNSNEAQKTRDYTEYMSNTAHQREVNDLKAAGLNPVLSAGGQGASTPSASNASAGNWSGATESALNAMATMAKAEMDNKTSLTSAKINSQTQKEIAGAQIRSGLLESYNNLLGNLIANKGGYKASMTSAKYGLAGALASAGAVEAAAAMSADASYNMAASQLAGVRTSADASKYVANKNFDSNKYAVDRSKYGYITNQVNKGAKTIKDKGPGKVKQFTNWINDKTKKKVQPSSW